MTSPIFYDVIKKYQRHNKILFDHNSVSLLSLINLIENSKHRVLILWAFFMVEQVCSQLKRDNVDDKLILNAVNITKSWSKGLLKMNEAKHSILTVHSMAKEFDNPSIIAKLHAIGHGLSTVHVKTHALGLIFYELTSIVRDFGIEHFESHVIKRIDFYEKKLDYYSNTYDYINQVWASFLIENK